MALETKQPMDEIGSRDHAHDHSRHHDLAVKGLCVSYGKVPALREIAFQTSCGRCLALIGPNGAGKTTLLKALAGLVPVDHGDILWKGKPIRSQRREFAYLPQRENVDWTFPATVRHVVEMGRYPHLGWWRAYRHTDHEVVESALNAMELTRLAHRQINALSGGQQQRVFLARAIAQEAHVLLLDEPFTGLDVPAQDNLAELLRNLSRQGRLIIASHHDLASVKGTFDEVMLINKHQIAFGTVENHFTPDNLSRVFERETVIQ